MKIIILLLLAASSPVWLQSQDTVRTSFVFIITTDGFRWQEVFNGADAAMVSSPVYNADTSFTRSMYWDDDLETRRKKLMPFFWNVIAQKGQLYGNRELGNKMNVKNIYKISYPGYSELLTGYADPYFIPNLPVFNRNINILEQLNQLPAYTDQVAVFASWNIFPYILHEKRSMLPLKIGYEPLEETGDSVKGIINLIQESTNPKGHTRHDWLTYLSAKEYVFSRHPKVLFLGLGETDEAAHNNRYDQYLQHAASVDKMISDLWYAVQTDPLYKDKTTFIITTDHGRGNSPQSWHNHGIFTRNSGQTWLAILGPGTFFPHGELSSTQQIYANQVAATVAQILGESLVSNHTKGKPILLKSIKQ